MIISRGGMLDFDLPHDDGSRVSTMLTTAAKDEDLETEFLTEAELHRREKQNLLIILRKTNWKIKGADGAAELLGVKATTLLTRMKKMGLKKL